MFLEDGSEVTTISNRLVADVDDRTKPLDVWVTTGEALIPKEQCIDYVRRELAAVKTDYTNMKHELQTLRSSTKMLTLKAQEEKDDIVKSTLEDELESHVLDQEEAERDLKQVASKLNALKQRQLEAYKPPKPPAPKSKSAVIKRLHKPQSKRVRVLVRKNGSPSMEPVLCFGCSMDELLRDIASSLHVQKVYKLFRKDGALISKLGSDIQGEEVLLLTQALVLALFALNLECSVCLFYIFTLLPFPGICIAG